MDVFGDGRLKRHQLITKGVVVDCSEIMSVPKNEGSTTGAVKDLYPRGHSDDFLGFHNNSISN